jgi:hypothetical protein
MRNFFWLIIPLVFLQTLGQAPRPGEKTAEQQVLERFDATAKPDEDQEFLRYAYLQKGRFTSENSKSALIEYLALGLLLKNNRQGYLSIRKELANPAEFEQDLFVGCEDCQGQKVKLLPCQECMGKKSCRICDGQGQRMVPSIREGQAIRPCTGCNSTGLCRACQGKGGVTQACRSCGGTGVEINQDLVREKIFTARVTLIRLLKEAPSP